MLRKKYSINWENDEPVSFEVNGVAYESLDQVPDEADREKLTAMMDASLEKEFKDFDKEFDKKFEAHKKSSVNVEKLILGIFSGVAALMLLIAGISSVSAVRKLSREASAPGRVVDMVVQREYVNQQDRIVRDYYYPVVEFTSSDGRRHTAQMTEGSQTPSHEVGDKITVQYDPDHPLDARIKSFGSDALMWVLPGIIAVRKLMSPEE